MIEKLANLPDGIFGYVASGPISQEEADTIFDDFQATMADGYEVSLLVVFKADVDLTHVSEDSRFHHRLSARGRTQKLALVAPHTLQHLAEDFLSVTGANMRTFAPGGEADAVDWLSQGL